MALIRSFALFSLCSFLFLSQDSTLALDNGLARTPPMGWMNWERFRCNIDCVNDPTNCVSEKLFMQMSDHLAEDGYKDAGYEYVSIDDCWSNKQRDSSGRLQPNSTRFPSGMKALADYMHARGLKLGMYGDYGSKTCAGYPGSISHITQDAETFASWGVDYLKLDTCNSDPSTFDVGYPKFGKALNATGRPILYSCGWPKAQVRKGLKVNYKGIAAACNTWRNYVDVQDSWDSVLEIVDYFAAHQDKFIAAAGPGHWNDPDQLVIGDFGLSYEQSKAQFALWSILAAPLTMSNDLRNISPEMRGILLNKEVIAVNQDKLGKMGRRVVDQETVENSNKSEFNQQNLELWTRPLMDGSVAALLFNRRSDQPHTISAPFELVGLSSVTAKVRDLFAYKDLGVFTKCFNASVNPSGVVMVKLTPVKQVNLKV